jgi:hypothetical protein
MTQEEVIVTAIAFVVGLVFKRPAIIQAAFERLLKKQK